MPLATEALTPNALPPCAPPLTQSPSPVNPTPEGVRRLSQPPFWQILAIAALPPLADAGATWVRQRTDTASSETATRPTIWRFMRITPIPSMASPAASRARPYFNPDRSV